MAVSSDMIRKIKIAFLRFFDFLDTFLKKDPGLG